MVDLETQRWIKTGEGLRLNFYIDTDGYKTIGWGRNLSQGISVSEAELMFQNDLKRALNELEECSWYLIQPRNVKNALLNMNFNLGITKLLQFKKMIAALEKKDFTKASIEALDSLWAKQVGERAKDIALMIRQG